MLTVIGALSYLTWMQHAFSRKTPQVAVRKAEMTVIVPNAVVSGVMRGSRWQVTPGGFGGFSSGGNAESR